MWHGVACWLNALNSATNLTLHLDNGISRFLASLAVYGICVCVRMRGIQLLPLVAEFSMLA